MKLKNVNITKQLRISLIIIFILVTIMGTLSLFTAHSLWQNTKTIYEHPFTVKRSISVLESDVLNMRLNMREIVIENNEQVTLARLRDISAFEADAYKQFKILYSAYLGAKTDIDDAYNSFVQWKPIRDETIKLMQAGKTAEAAQRTTINGIGGIQSILVLNELSVINTFAMNKAESLYREALTLRNQAILEMASVFTATIIFLTVISIVFKKNILIPLKELAAATRTFQQSEQNAKCHYNSNNEFGALSESFNAMVETVQNGMANRKKDLDQAITNLNESEALLRSVVENAQDAFYRRNVARGKFDYISAVIERVAGFTKEEMMTMSFEQMMGRVHPDDLPQLSAVMKDGVSSGKSYFELDFRFLDKTEQFRWLRDRSSLVRDDLNVPLYLFGTLSNITEQKKSEAEIMYLNFHDVLTGLHNRSYFESARLYMDDEKYLPLTFAMADVNGLKLINDAYGHKTGDMLLKEVAGILKKVCRPTDVVARTCGGEFVMLLPKTDARSAEAVISRIHAAIAIVKMDTIIFSVSIGYAVKFDMSYDIDEVVIKAEDEMFKHKLYESTSMRSKTIDVIMNSLYEKSNREMLHSRRVSNICESVSTIMKLDADFINQIKLLGLVHDIGKIGVDEQILNAPRKLSDEEYNEIKKHPEIGSRILNSAKEFSELAEYVLEHHERWDGKGYPKGLKGEEISLQARIIAVADSYDAMTIDRSYRAALSDDEAADEIKKCSGTQFDPNIAKVFVEDYLGKK